MSKLKYAFRVIWSEEDQEYVGLCAEFPSLSWLEDSPTKALAGIYRTVKQAVRDMNEAGETVPEPIAVRKYSGTFNVRVSPELHRALALKSAETGVSIQRIVRERLQEAC
jgi:predicted HicB family RNase H-like nuclease